MHPNNADIVVDALMRGRLRLVQPTRGYRVNADALYLAAFAAAGGRPASIALDLGAGVGTIGLSLLVTNHARSVTLLEIDESFAALARRNVKDMGLEDRVDVVLADLADPIEKPLRSRFDLVVANPPFGMQGAAKAPPDPVRARARIGDESTLYSFARAARASLGRAGRACFVFPCADLARLLATFRGVGLEPKRMRLVHSLPNAPAYIVLIEAKPGRKGGLRVERPLIVMTNPGEWSPEARAIVEGEW